MDTHEEHSDGYGSMKQMAAFIAVFCAIAYVSVTIIMYFEYPSVRAKMDGYFVEVLTMSHITTR